MAPALLITWCVRHWVFSKLPPFDQPFVDNPLVGADFLTARLTAMKVMIKYIWPADVAAVAFLGLFLQPDSAGDLGRRLGGTGSA